MARTLSPIPRGETLTTVIIEGKGAAALRALKGAQRVLKRTENDGSDKAAMLHQLLKLTNRLMAPFSTHLAHRYKISLNEFRLLMTIGALGKTASHELAELTGVNVMSVSRAVATLQRHGRIEVVPDPANRRRKWLSLTEEGQRLYAIMRPQSEKVADYLFSDLDAGEIAQLEDDPDPADRHARSEGRARAARCSSSGRNPNDRGRAPRDRGRLRAADQALRQLERRAGLAARWPRSTPRTRASRGQAAAAIRQGREAILASFRARPPRVQRHVIANVVVEVEDADHARAFCAIVLYQGDSRARRRAAGDERRTRRWSARSPTGWCGRAKAGVSPSAWSMPRLRRWVTGAAKTLGRMRKLIREADPEVAEEVKWRKPSNPLGVPVWEHAGIICTGETLPDLRQADLRQGRCARRSRGPVQHRLRRQHPARDRHPRGC